VRDVPPERIEADVALSDVALSDVALSGIAAGAIAGNTGPAAQRRS
jgi:hypothetical protein